MPNEPTQAQSFSIERHGEIAIITPSPEVEKMPENLREQAAKIVLAPLRTDPPAALVPDPVGVRFTAPSTTFTTTGPSTLRRPASSTWRSRFARRLTS